MKYPAFLTLLASSAALGVAFGEFTSETIPYTHDGTKCEGYLSEPLGLKEGEKRPGILLIHDWTGLQDYARQRADMLADLGYVVFAADVYGVGVRPTDPKECAAEAGKYKTDRKLYRARLNAALEVLKAQPHCDASQLGAIGYCFGGTGVLELARSGADVAGVVAFHGAIDSPNPADGANIKAKILVLHGADDPFVPAEDIAAFTEEMRKHQVDWQMVSYGNAVHSFTKKAAGDDNSKGAAYNEKADRRSWIAMKAFFEELFGS